MRVIVPTVCHGDESVGRCRVCTGRIESALGQGTGTLSGVAILRIKAAGSIRAGKGRQRAPISDPLPRRRKPASTKEPPKRRRPARRDADKS
jgi:hypothetical protein